MFSKLTKWLLGKKGYSVLRTDELVKIRKSAPPFDMITAARFLYFQNLFLKTMQVPGQIVECGVGRGYSTSCLLYLVKLYRSEKTVWGFDSFEGFPEPTSQDDPRVHGVAKGDYAVDLATVMDRLIGSTGDELLVRNTFIPVKGFYEETLNRPLRIDAISLLNLDVDLYASYRICLEKLYPLVSDGGIITFDEYIREGSTKFPGARQAIDEFFADKDVKFLKDEFYGKYYLIKGR